MSDYPAVRDMLTDVQMQRYESDDLSEAHAQDFFAVLMKDCEDKQMNRQRWKIIVPPDETALGLVHLLSLNEHIREYEIGCMVRREYWGRGIATEAARAVLNYGFDCLNAHRVTGFCHAQNIASEKVMLKLGMQRDGLLRQVRRLNGIWYDELVYAILDCDLRK